MNIQQKFSLWRQACSKVEEVEGKEEQKSELRWTARKLGLDENFIDEMLSLSEDEDE